MPMEESVILTDSILDSIKKLIGPGVEHNFFDSDLIMHINSAFMILNQVGVGPTIPFKIYDNTATWQDFIPDRDNYQSIIDYVYLRCKLIFDPPSSSFVLSALKEQQQELEWRLNIMAETPTWNINTETEPESETE